MLPLRDENASRHVPWVTWVLIAANVAVFALEARAYLAGGPTGLGSLVRLWGFEPARFLAGLIDPREWATAFTSMFLHAGWLHLGGNMLYLSIFGRGVEDRLGHVRYLAFYLACGLAATAAQAAVAPGSTVPMVGASGAIAGILGAYLLFFPRARIVTAVFLIVYFELTTLPAALVIVVWFVLQLAAAVDGFTRTAAGSGGIAYVAHVGGFVTGILLAMLMRGADSRGKTRFVGWRR